MVDMPKTRMTAKEFMELPENTAFVELLDGGIIVSPTPKTPHQRSVRAIFRYLDQTVPSGEVLFAPLSVHFDADNVPEPDVFWVSGPESKCKLGEDGYWHGAPDLIVEVLSPSTEDRDRDDKFTLYQKYGVREYWLVGANFIEVYVLVNGKFERLGAFGRGKKFQSPVLGATVDVSAVLGA